MSFSAEKGWGCLMIDEVPVGGGGLICNGWERNKGKGKREDGKREGVGWLGWGR